VKFAVVLAVHSSRMSPAAVLELVEQKSVDPSQMHSLQLAVESIHHMVVAVLHIVVADPYIGELADIHRKEVELLVEPMAVGGPRAYTLLVGGNHQEGLV
jgi:hypothetical protein